LICKAGPIELNYGNGVARASIPHNVHIHTESPLQVEQLYKSQPALSDLEKPKAIDLVSPVKGMNFICVEMASLEVLAQVKISGVRATAHLDQGWDSGLLASYFYVVTAREDSKLTIRTRMLEPAFEDPATGSAACALGSFLALKHKLKTADIAITQGVEMGRQSDIGIKVTLKDSLEEVESVELSGSAVKVMEGTVDYE
jgi:PhzF family phenazine biosynthesis protein